jgi:hypothetical protein
MNIYISGKITGDSGYRQKFLDAAASLRRAGYCPLNPAPLGMPVDDWSAAMREALRLMLESGGVAVLPGWRKSRGAKIEVHLARGLGIPVKPLREWLKEAGKDPRFSGRENEVLP